MRVLLLEEVLHILLASGKLPESDILLGHPHLHSRKSTVYSLQFTVYSLQSIVYNPQSTVYSRQSSQWTSVYSL